MSPPLERLARKVQDDPCFLAAALAIYARQEGLEDTALAAKLGCGVADLTGLRLCRMPRPKAPFFWQDVEQIVKRFPVEAEALAEMVRRGQSVLHWREAAAACSSESAGLL